MGDDDDRTAWATSLNDIAQLDLLDFSGAHRPRVVVYLRDGEVAAHQLDLVGYFGNDTEG